jgi:UDP-glucose 4-epimerase
MSLCLVTGGAGFIGSHLVEALLEEGHDVRVLDDFSTGSLINLANVLGKIEVIGGDLADLDLVRKAVEGVDVVFHQAALPSVPVSIDDPIPTHQACAQGTLHVLVAARDARVGRVVYGGSATAYGDTGHTPTSETETPQPLSPYAAAKLTGEHYCLSFSCAYGLETVRLRYFNVYGPRQRAGNPGSAVVPTFFEAMLNGERPVIFGDGMQTRDFTFVSDVVQANLLAAKAPRVSSRVYNIATGRSTTVLELVEMMNTILGTRIRPIHTRSRPGEIRESTGDIARAQTDLGYCPCVDLVKGLRLCLEECPERLKGPKFLSRFAAHQLN